MFPLAKFTNIESFLALFSCSRMFATINGKADDGFFVGSNRNRVRSIIYLQPDVFLFTIDVKNYHLEQVKFVIFTLEFQVIGENRKTHPQ